MENVEQLYSDMAFRMKKRRNKIRKERIIENTIYALFFASMFIWLLV